MSKGTGLAPLALALGHKLVAQARGRQIGTRPQLLLRVSEVAFIPHEAALGAEVLAHLGELQGLSCLNAGHLELGVRSYIW